MADVAINADGANIPSVNFGVQGSDPSAPGSGRAQLYVKSGGAYVRYSTGSPVQLGGSPALAEGRLAVGDGGGLLSALALGTEDQVVTADASGFATWAALPAGGGSGTETYRQEVCPQGYSAYTGGVPTFVNVTNQVMYGVWQQSSAADQDDVSFILDLSAGTWAMRVLWFRYTNKGIVDAYLDATEIGSQDMYGSQLSSQVWTITGITVATGGLHTLKFKVDGKNASSSAYYYGISWASLWRTA
jgi:hypothetical protein